MPDITPKYIEGLTKAIDLCCRGCQNWLSILDNYAKICGAESRLERVSSYDFVVAFTCDKFLVTPVRHGHWDTISDSDMSKNVMCSVCNKMFYFAKKGQLNIDKMPHCPNCGAKMDGGEDNG